MGIIIIITKAMEDMSPVLVDLLHQSWPMGLVQHTEDMITWQRAILKDESMADLVAESVRMSSEESMADLVAESVRIVVSSKSKLSQVS